MRWPHVPFLRLTAPSPSGKLHRLTDQLAPVHQTIFYRGGAKAAIEWTTCSGVSRSRVRLGKARLALKLFHPKPSISHPKPVRATTHLSATSPCYIHTGRPTWLPALPLRCIASTLQWCRDSSCSVPSGPASDRSPYIGAEEDHFPTGLVQGSSAGSNGY